MPNRTIYISDDHDDKIDAIQAATDAENRSQAVQQAIEAYEL